MNAEYKLLATSVNFGTAIKLLFEAIRTTSCLVCGLDMNESRILAWLWKPTMRTLSFLYVSHEIYTSSALCIASPLSTLTLI